MSLRLDSSSKYLNRTTGLPSISSFTIMGWVKITVNIGGYNAFFCFGSADASEDFYYVGTNGDGISELLYNGSAGFTSGFTYVVGTWYFFAIVVDGTSTGNCRLYRDGALVITGDGSAAITAVNIYVGKDTTGDNADMACENVMVYSAALTLAEIQQQMWQRFPVRTANLNSWTPELNDNKDYSGAGNDWTAAGSPAFETTGPGVQWRRANPRVIFPPVAAGGGGGTVLTRFYYDMIGAR